MVLLTSAGLVLAPAVQGRVAAQAQGVEGPAVVVIHQLSDLLQTHAPHPAEGTSEILVHHHPVNAHCLEDLGRLVGLDGRDTHLGGDLHDAAEDGLVIVLHRGVVILVQQTLVNEGADGRMGQIGVHRPGTVAQQRGEVVHVPGFR